jgi:hypothetical protein
LQYGLIREQSYKTAKKFFPKNYDFQLNLDFKTVEKMASVHPIPLT